MIKASSPPLQESSVRNYNSTVQNSVFYIRVLTDEIPEDKKPAFLFRGDRNYPVLAVDSEKNRILVHDDQNRLVWIPMGVTRFVKLT